MWLSAIVGAVVLRCRKSITQITLRSPRILNLSNCIHSINCCLSGGSGGRWGWSRGNNCSIPFVDTLKKQKRKSCCVTLNVSCFGAKHASSLHPNHLLHSPKKKLINMPFLREWTRGKQPLHLPLPRFTSIHFYKTADLRHLLELRNKNTKLLFCSVFFFF